MKTKSNVIKKIVMGIILIIILVIGFIMFPWNL